MVLTKYRQKRDFAKTSEPKGHLKLKNKVSLFVIQKHEASRLHYDFRLEVGGVLKSWAVPKGLPETPSDKRLAVETEDHPLEYANFSGTIPTGLYGAGIVEIWDKGIYENITIKDGRKIKIQQALKNGHLNINLRGEKVNGEYSLINLNNDKRQWLIIKRKANE